MRFAACLAVTPALLFAAPQAYFSAQDDLQAKVAASIQESRSSLQVALFQLSSKPLMKALENAASRGVSVRVLLNASTPKNAHASTLGRDVEIRYLPGRGRRSGVMHNKFMVVDQQKLITGSFNWTAGAQYANYENILVEDDAAVVSAYSRQFDSLWRQAQRRPPKTASHRRGHP